MLTEQQHILLESYLTEILEQNKRVNLTTITSMEEGRVLHLEDSLAAVDLVEDAPSGALVDLGTGGGFPGVPLAVATGRNTLLVDSTKKKLNSVEDVLQTLNIENVCTYAGRIEELAAAEGEKFAVATARALAPLPVLLELAAPLLVIGGLLIAYKTPGSADEIERACSIQNIMGMDHVTTKQVTLSDGTTERSIVVFKKTAAPSVPLPRRNGMAQKKPYA